MLFNIKNESEKTLTCEGFTLGGGGLGGGFLFCVLLVRGSDADLGRPFWDNLWDGTLVLPVLYMLSSSPWSMMSRSSFLQVFKAFELWIMLKLVRKQDVGKNFTDYTFKFPKLPICSSLSIFQQ